MGTELIVDPPPNGGGFCYVKIFWTCANRTKSFGELPCPKRSTGTFWRFSKFVPLKGDFAVNFVYYCGRATRALPLDPASL